MNNSITALIIGTLLLIIIIEKACTPTIEKQKKDTISVVTKIVYVPVHDSLYTKPKIIIRRLPSLPLPPEYLPDTNYAALHKQYEKLVIAHLTENVYVDKLILDSLGSITVIDTTQFNKLKKRKYTLNLRIPRIIDSIFVVNPALLKRQLYAGVGITSTQLLGTLGLRGSLLYKDKKDNIFSPSLTVTTNGAVIIGIDTYFKFKLR